MISSQLSAILRDYAHQGGELEYPSDTPGVALVFHGDECITVGSEPNASTVNRRASKKTKRRGRSEARAWMRVLSKGVQAATTFAPGQREGTTSPGMFQSIGFPECQR